jgi:copper chaperone CopZ
MVFTKRVKEQLENANTKEEVQVILDKIRKNVEEAGVILNDEDLDVASGGGLISKNDGGYTGGGMGLMHK